MSRASRAIARDLSPHRVADQARSFIGHACAAQTQDSKMEAIIKNAKSQAGRAANDLRNIGIVKNQALAALAEGDQATVQRLLLEIGSLADTAEGRVNQVDIDMFDALTLEADDVQRNRSIKQNAGIQRDEATTAVRFRGERAFQTDGWRPGPGGGAA